MPDNLEDAMILDVASGLGEWGYILKTRKTGSSSLSGIERWKPYLEPVRKVGHYDNLIQGDVKWWPFKSESFDYCVCCEVLEHLNSKDEGITLLDHLEKTCKRKVIISTPHGYYPQGEIRGNPHEKHKTIWTEQDLINLGYETEVIEKQALPGRFLKLVDKVRRFVFGLPRAPKLIVAYKNVARA